MEKDKLVYSTDKSKKIYREERERFSHQPDENVRRIGLDDAKIALARAIRAQDQAAYEQTLVDMGAKRGTASFKARVAAFRKNCNLD